MPIHLLLFKFEATNSLDGELNATPSGVLTVEGARESLYFGRLANDVVNENWPDS